MNSPPCDLYICVTRTYSTQNGTVHLYFKKVPSALPNPNSSLSGRMPSEAISSANHELLGLVHQDTEKNSKHQKAFLPPSRVNPYPLWFHVVNNVEMLNYEGVSAMCECYATRPRPSRKYFSGN